MKTFPKILLGCGVVVGLFVVVVAMGAWWFVRDVVPSIDISTGPRHTATSYYKVEGDRVYYTSSDTLENETPLEGADAKTFKTLDNHTLAKDAKNVYYEGRAIPGADAATFRVSSHQNGDSPDKNAPLVLSEMGRYAGDAQHTYFDGKVIEGARGQDATSVIEEYGDSKARDKHHVYYKDTVVEGADPASFELIGGGWMGRDKHDYYTPQYVGNEIRLLRMKVDMASFKLLVPTTTSTTGGFDPWNHIDKLLWAYDKQHYYVGDKACPIADASTFVVLDFGYAKDAKQAYFLDKVIPGADGVTFQLVSPDHDKNWGHEFGCYAKDAKHIYYQARVIEGADVATFTVVDERFFKDKNHRYLLGKVQGNE
jgi:hypothetical protein